MPGVLVLITGTGRSGTSTMSGALHHLGLHVPGPHLGADDSNPKGFWESRWAVRFHKRLAKAAGIDQFDSRPGALARAQTAITPQMREQVTEFLRGHATEHDQVVIKDPRSVWTQELWRTSAADAGLDIRYVAMLRHPAEVVGSRTTYYSGHAHEGGDEAKRRRYSIFNVARWTNSSLINERETRGFPRAFVRYTDMLDDWRPVMADVRDDLGLTFDTDLAPGAHHAVDDFIEPGLRRHTVTWEELDIPTDLQRVAQQVWEQLDVLADSHGVDEAASARLDELADEYARVLADAHAISHDAILEAQANAKAEAAEELAALRRASLEARPVGDVGGRDLLKVLSRQVAARLRIRNR
jgi:hypothetical protein